MNWILEHLQIVIAIVAAIAYMLKRGKPEDEAAGDPGEDDERSRKIREEIRRKIAERREGGAAPASQAPAAPPVIRPTVRPTLQPVDPFGGPAKPSSLPLPTFRKAEPAPAQVPQPDAPSLSAVLERQQQLAEQMKELERNRAAQQRRAAEIAARQRETATATARSDAAGDRDGWLEDLRTGQGLRRAMIQREILGPPVALR